MAGLSDYKVTDKDIDMLAFIDNHKCNHECASCPYGIFIVGSSYYWCTLDYIYDRLIQARESEG